MWIGTIPQILIGIALGEAIGRLIFFRFRCTWITNVAIILSGLFVIILMAAVRETATSFTLPHAGVSGSGVSYMCWLFFRMYARKKHGTEPQIGTLKDDKPPTGWPNINQPEIPIDDTRDTNFENKWYSIALEEVENSNPDKALWARALSQNQGDTNRATATYIDLRVTRFRQEFQRKEKKKKKRDRPKHANNWKRWRKAI